jgi:hypothetical protein
VEKMKNKIIKLLGISSCVLFVLLVLIPGTTEATSMSYKQAQQYAQEEYGLKNNWATLYVYPGYENGEWFVPMWIWDLGLDPMNTSPGMIIVNE